MRTQLPRSPQRTNAVRFSLLALVTLAVALGCRSGPTEPDPFMRGTISTISASAVRIAQSSGCGAIAMVTDDTVIERANGEPVPFSALAVGDWVAVWHTDRVLDSCPQQISARRIRLQQ